MYSAAYGWWLKLGLSISVLLAGILLQSTGFDANVAVQSERTLFLIRAWEIGLPSVLCFIGVVLLLKCPLTEERAYEVKRLLAERRGVVLESGVDRAKELYADEQDTNGRATL